MDQEELDLMDAEDAAADAEWAELLMEYEQNDRKEAGDDDQDSSTSSV